MGDDPGTIEPGYYTVADGVVTLTDRDGKPVALGTDAARLHLEGWR
jgi:hypothetical protein